MGNRMGRVCRFLMGKHGGNNHLENMYKWKDDIKADLNEVFTINYQQMH
jgi:hypothetical protein